MNKSGVEQVKLIKNNAKKYGKLDINNKVYTDK